ncbi:MAG: hypothetical protein OXH85_02215, partial [Truepera sp.]|nr:hypothetical protein [Truepera sp.]
SENGKWYPDLDCVVCSAVLLKECSALQKCPYPLDVGATLDGWYSQQLALGLETATLCHIIVQRIWEWIGRKKPGIIPGKPPD